MSTGNVDYAIVPSYALAARDVRYHSVAALTFLIWQAILTFDEEVEYVWPMPNQSLFKWTYIYVHYVGIAAHVLHNCLMERLADGTNPPILCAMWGVYIICFNQSLATSLEFLLAVRVFALYNRSRRVGLLLSTLILAEIGGSVRMLWLRDSIRFHETCLLSLLSNSSTVQTVLGFIVHCTLIGLTLFKYIAAFRGGRGRTPLVSLIIRDGSTVYAAEFFMLISVLLIFGLEKERGVAIFFWASALLGVTGRYLVVSMARFARRDIPVDMPRPVLTSRFGMGIDDFTQ